MTRHREAAEAVMRRAAADNGLTLDAITEELAKVYDRADVSADAFREQIARELEAVREEMAELWRDRHGQTISCLTRPEETRERAALRYLAGMSPSVETKQ